MAIIDYLPCPMPDPNTPEPITAAQRQRLYRQRKAGLAPGGRRVPCENCLRRHTGTHGLLCWECARQTPEGRTTVARLVWELRQRQKQKAKLKGDNP
jgi:hypothetical protein